MYEVRQMKKSDFNDVRRIFIKEWRNPPYFEKWEPKKALERIKELFFDKEFCFVIEYEKRIIGYVFANRFIWYNGRLVFINDLVISGDYQGRGAGKEILNHIVNFCKEREIKGIFLSAHLESSAIGFYEKLGFKRTKWMWFEKKL